MSKSSELLKQQHRDVEALFAKIEKAETSDEKRPLVRELAKSLAAHMQIEQELFYPAAAKALDDDSSIREGYEEHGVAQFQLLRLLEIRTNDKSFDTKVGVLKELIAHHVEEEEREMFPKSERALGAEASKALAERMKDAFEKQLAEGFEPVLERGSDARDIDPRRAATGASKKATLPPGQTTTTRA